MITLVLSKPTDVASLLIVRHTYTQVHKWNIQSSQSSFELHIMIVPTFLRSIPWGHQYLQFFELTRFELMTLNLQLHRSEIHHWFTSHLLQSNNDTPQCRALHDSRISSFWPISVSLLHPSRRLRSLLKHASRSSTFILAVYLELIDLCHAWNLRCQFEFSIQSYIQAFQFEITYTHQLMSHSLFSCLLPLYNNIHLIWQVFLIWDNICTSTHNLYLSYEFHQKSNKPLIDIGAFMSIMSTLLSIFFYNFACHFESHINSQTSTIY